MKKLLSILSASICSVCLLCSCEKPNEINTSVVPNLDLERYMGTWYEIGRYDISFEKGLVGVTANYKLLDNGMVQVINTGYKESLDGKIDIIEGKAKRQDKNATNGALKVAFFLDFYAQYNVMELADDYSWSLVGSKTDKYLWILSRTPSLDTNTLEHILRLAANRGYDTSKILWVEQQNEE